MDSSVARIRRRSAVTAGGLAACAALVTSGCATSGTSPETGTGATPAVARTAASWTPVVVRDGAGPHAVTVVAGQRLEIILASTYWTVSGSSRPGVLRQDGPSSELAKPPGCGSIPGLGCAPIRTDFSALSPGTAIISASRTSCGEALLCQPAQRHFTLTVTVRAR